MPARYDVAILGGGLAGGCLARQLRLEAPALRVLVVEKRRHPVREAAFKVGESSVEIGAHYFQKRLGLEPHLRSAQLEKLGLRYFFTRGDNRDVAARVELGPAAFPPVPSFQLDRGRLENFLLRENAALGVTVVDGCRVQSIALDRGGDHHVTIADEDGRIREIAARWIVDASGRAGLLKRQLGLVRASTHAANAAWWRFRSRIAIDDWSRDSSWRARVPSGLRWHSTVHLMGVGYWFWLIPLASGSHSFGIVADAELHPFARINRFERALDWLREFEPQAAVHMEAHAHELEDFLALQHFAHGCARVFSPDRWGLVGEAGVFTDPFYSPGSDFIAMGNDYVTDLILREIRGEDVRARTEIFNTNYLRFFDAFIRLYLSPQHRDRCADGCPSAALLDEIPRRPDATRQIFTDELMGVINDIATRLDTTDAAAARINALTVLGLMIGALQLARAMTDRDLSDQLLAHGTESALKLLDDPASFTART